MPRVEYSEGGRGGGDQEDEGGLASELKHEIRRLAGNLDQQHRAVSRRDEELMKAEKYVGLVLIVALFLSL